MATLVVREVENELVAALKERAGRHGRSAEAEHRAILEEVLNPRHTTQDLIEAVQRMDWLADLDAGELRNPAFVDAPSSPPLPRKRGSRSWTGSGRAASFTGWQTGRHWMGALVLEDVADETIRRLEERAKTHGRSVEAEALEIIEAQVRKPLTTAEWAEQLAGTWIGELDPDELRDRSDPGRVFDWP